MVRGSAPAPHTQLFTAPLALLTSRFWRFPLPSQNPKYATGSWGQKVEDRGHACSACVCRSTRLQILRPTFSDRPRDVAMATNFMAKLVTPPSFGTLAFRNGLDDRNFDIKKY